MKKTVLCPSCSNKAIYKFKKLSFFNYYTYYSCPSCSLLFVSPIPSKKELSTYYNSAYQVPFSVQQTKINSKSNALLKLMHTSGLKKGSVMEFGCSYGFFLKKLSDLGFKVTGVDLSSKAISYCKNTLNITDVYASDIVDLKIKKKFDHLIMMDVLEHFHSLDDSMKSINSFLKKGGHFIITTPNLNSLEYYLFGKYWEWVSPPDHLLLFNKKSLDILMNKYGFEKVSVSFGLGDTAGNTMFHFFLSLRSRLIYLIFSCLPSSYKKKLVSNYLKNKNSNSSNSSSKEFSGFLGFLRSFSSFFDFLFRKSILRKGPTMFAIYRKK